MYQLKSTDDTIAAISTPAGVGGIGVVRLSGKKALFIADKMFMPASGKNLKRQKTFTAHYGWVVERKNRKDHIVDEALVTLMKAPKSYTKEDVVEISCHGSVVSLRRILTLATRLGARLAEPGEFTKRAFLNGRIDLAQAEAVLDVIHSRTNAFLKISTNQLKGELSTQLESIRKKLMTAYVEMEAIVNFPEDDVDTKSVTRISGYVQSARDSVEELLKGSEHGRLLKEGIKIVICGRPNVGKSSLLNVILKQPRAIVSNVAGTTRDAIEETAQIKGIPFQLVDTAGILEPRDLIEEEAMKRSRLYMEGADLVLLVLDNSEPFSQQDKQVIEKVHKRNTLVVINKCDLKKRLDRQEINGRFDKEKIVEISVLKKEGADLLQERIVDIVSQTKDIDTHGIYISNLRHIQALEDCKQTLEKAAGLLGDKISLEFISEEVKTAVNYLDAITGRNIDSDLIDQIFSEFCIGK